MAKSGKSKCSRGKFWHTGNLHTSRIVANKSTQIPPNPVKLWTEYQHIMGMVLKLYEVEDLNCFGDHPDGALGGGGGGWHRH